jgi:5-dehydro-4-deoxyglucarate dehydratase
VNPSFAIKQAGPLVFPITPFRDEGLIDLDSFRQHLRWLLQYEPPALFIACGTGEFISLDVDEVGELVRAAVEMVGSEVPVYAGTGQGLPLARRYARAAEGAGASGVLVLPPYLVQGEQTGLIGYYRDLATATSIGLILYQRDNAVFDPETVVRLAAIPNIIGFKDGLGEIERMQHIVNHVGPELVYFNGMPTAETYQPAYAAVGVPHYSSAVFNFVPEISWAYFRALGTGDAEAINHLLRIFFLPLVHLRNQVRGYAVSLIKAGVAIRQGIDGPVRAPLVDTQDRHIEELRKIIDEGLKVI